MICQICVLHWDEIKTKHLLYVQLANGGGVKIFCLKSWKYTLKWEGGKAHHTIFSSAPHKTSHFTIISSYHTICFCVFRRIILCLNTLFSNLGQRHVFNLTKTENLCASLIFRPNHTLFCSYFTPKLQLLGDSHFIFNPYINNRTWLKLGI